MQLRNRMLGILVAVTLCGPGAAYAQPGTAAQLIIGSLPQSRSLTGGDSWSGSLTGAVVRIPPSTRSRTFFVSLNVTLELTSVTPADPHLMGAIRIIDVTTGAVVASSPVSLNNGRNNGALVLPVTLQGIYRAPASGNSTTLGVELYSRAGTRVTIQPKMGLHGTTVGEGSFSALLVN
jgi:hypothetical protein